MAKARTLLLLLFASILFLLTVFWFSTSFHSSSLIHLNGLERVLAFLQDKRNNSNVYTFTSSEVHNSVEFFHSLEHEYAVKNHNFLEGSPPSAYDSSHRTTSNSHYSNDNHASKVSDSFYENYKEEVKISKVMPGHVIMRKKNGIFFSPIDERPTSQSVNSPDQRFDSAENGYFNGETVSNMPLEDTVLTKKNFSNFVSENKFVAVQFYLPWAYSKDIQSLNYTEAATALEGKVVFAKVDAQEEKELARKYRFMGLATLYFFIDGVHLYTFRYCCNRDIILPFLKEKMTGGVQSVTRTTEARDILEIDSMIILAFFNSLEGPDSKEFAAASKLENNIIFYQARSRHILSKFDLDLGVKSPELFMLRKGAKKFLKFEGPFNRLAIADFVSKNKFPLITTFNAHNAEAILRNPMKQLWIFAIDNEMGKFKPMIKEAAGAFNGKLLFVYIKMDHKDIGMKLANEIGATRNETKVIAYSRADGAVKYAMKSELSLRNIKSFGEDFIEDKLVGDPIIPSSNLFLRDEDSDVVIYHKPRTTPPQVINYEKDLVVELNEKNFSQFILKNRYVMIHFYSPECYFSKNLAPEYAAAASILKEEAVFAKVDISMETVPDLIKKYKTRIIVTSTMYFFIGGIDMYDYNDERKRDAIVSWVRRKMTTGVYSLTATWQAFDVLISDSMIIIALLDTLEGPDSVELAAAAKQNSDLIFYQTANISVAETLFLNPEVKRPALFIRRKDAEHYIHFDGPFTRSAIANFIAMNKFPLVTTFTENYCNLIFANPMRQVWLFAPETNSEVISTFQEAAKYFNGKLLFVHIETSKKDVGGRLSHDLGISGDEVRVIAYIDLTVKHVMKGQISLINIKEFGNDIMEDKL